MCARRWLRPGGALLPDRVSLHLAAAGARALDLAFWDNVQGFSYAPVRAWLAPRALRSTLRSPGSTWGAGYRASLVSGHRLDLACGLCCLATPT